MKIYTPNQLRYILNYIIEKPELISKIDSEYFHDEIKIKRIFFEIKKYYSKYFNVPTPSILWTELNKDDGSYNKEQVTQQYVIDLFKQDGSLDESYIKNLFEEWVVYQDDVIELNKRIDESRSGKISKDKNANEILGLDEEDEETDDDILSNSPTFSDDIYKNLPDILKRMCDNFDISREKDIFLLSELTVLSVCFPKIKGVYWYENIYPNLYQLIIANAGSGKSAMKYAYDTLFKYLMELKKTYKLQVEEHIKSGGDKNNLPKEKYLKLGGDSSCAVLFEDLENNDGNGLIFETEADVISEAFKKEWGKYDTMLRQAFQHETISTHRLTKRIVIDEPKIGVAISGTPRQLITLIPSAESGLFSRFNYYIFKSKTKFLNPFATTISKKEIFQKFSNEIYNMILYYNEITPSISLTEKQAERFTQFINEKEEILKLLHTEDIDSVIKRFGTKTFKMIEIFTIIRNYENKGIFPEKNIIYPTDEDIETVLSILDVLIKHTEIVYTNLSTKDNVVIKNNPKEKLVTFILQQKGEFKRNKIVDKGKELSINERSVNRLLKDLEEQSKITKVKYGVYTVN